MCILGRDRVRTWGLDWHLIIYGYVSWCVTYNMYLVEKGNVISATTISRDIFHGADTTSSDHNLGAVWKLLVGSIPPPILQGRVSLNPVATASPAWSIVPNLQLFITNTWLIIPWLCIYFPENWFGMGVNYFNRQLLRSLIVQVSA